MLRNHEIIHSERKQKEEKYRIYNAYQMPRLGKTQYNTVGNAVIPKEATPNINDKNSSVTHLP